MEESMYAPTRGIWKGIALAIVATIVIALVIYLANAGYFGPI